MGGGGLKNCNMTFEISLAKFDHRPFGKKLKFFVLPPIQSQILDRIFKVFILYFASKVMLKDHISIRKSEKRGSVNVSTHIVNNLIVNAYANSRPI